MISEVTASVYFEEDDYRNKAKKDIFHADPDDNLTEHIVLGQKK